MVMKWRNFYSDSSYIYAQCSFDNQYEVFYFVSKVPIFFHLIYFSFSVGQVVGQGSQPFVFSRKFFYSASSSPFPVGTGKRARELSIWLNQQDETLMSEGVSLFPDPQCGDTIHLLSLVSSGELNITPCVPEEGVGELDEPEMSKRPSLSPTNQPDNIDNHKRKSVEADLGDGVDKAKKVKKIDARFLTRKVKGFPGVRVRITREVAPLDHHAMYGMCEERFGSSSARLSCGTENQNELCSSVVMTTGESCWGDMKAYFSAISATDISSDVFRSVLSLIHQAGERGVSMEEISDALCPLGTAFFPLFFFLCWVFVCACHSLLLPCTYFLFLFPPFLSS